MWAQDTVVLTNRELGVIYYRSTVQFIFFVREIPHSQLNLTFTPHKKNTTENHRHHWAVSKDKKNSLQLHKNLLQSSLLLCRHDREQRAI